MNNLPIFYDYMNLATSSISPNTFHITDSGIYKFFQRSLLQKAMGVFKFDFPKEWPVNYCLYALFCCGYFAVFPTAEFGVIPQACTLGGFDVFYQPNRALISNPILKTKDFKIGVDCELIKLQPDYGGIMDTVSFYGGLLAMNSEALITNIINSKFSYVFTTDSKAGAETAKKLYEEISKGNPAVVLDKSAFGPDGQSFRWEKFEQNVKNNFISPDILDVMRELENRFCTEIGLPNANTDKKERLITDEVNANNAETKSRVNLWLDELKKCCANVNKKYGLDLSVELRGETDGELYGNDNRSAEVEPGVVE